MLAAGPELRITGAAAQTRMVSVARIRLVSRKSPRLFKGIICDDISEFESHMPSHAVQSPNAPARSTKSQLACDVRGDVAGREARRDEPGRDGTLQHDALSKVGQRQLQLRRACFFGRMVLVIW